MRNSPLSAEELAPPVYQVVSTTQSVLQAAPLVYIPVGKLSQEEETNDDEEEEEQPKVFWHFCPISNHTYVLLLNNKFSLSLKNR